MRLSFILLSLCIILFSCNHEVNSADEQEILMLIRKKVPDKIASPPLPIENENIVEENKKDSISFKYAINSNYFLLDKEFSFSSKSLKYKNSENRFGKVEIDSASYRLLEKLLTFDKEEKIKEKIIEKILGEKTIILNRQFIKDTDKKDYEIDGIISFSKISFNEEKNIATILRVI